MYVPEVSQKLVRLLAWRQSANQESPPTRPSDEQPLRAELFSIDQLERHAETIAASHPLDAGRARNKLLPRLDENQPQRLYRLVSVGRAAHALVRPNDRLILLLDPPFDKSDLNPGYIKGYVPGVRENGGQYTHSAIWTVMATAAMGNSERAWELLSLINPISHGATPAEIATYRVEPYVVAADVYGAEPHTGRGGWTWYTGSAGWMYRLIVESLLGLHLEVDKLRITPCLPVEWKKFQIHYRYHETFYHITLHNNGAGATACRLTLDGVELSDAFITLIDDGRDHEIEIQTQPNEFLATPI